MIAIPSIPQQIAAAAARHILRKADSLGRVRPRHREQDIIDSSMGLPLLAATWMLPALFRQL